jgi:hypothetical protein
VVKEGRRKKYVNSKLVASDKEVDEKVQQQKITKIIPSTVNKSLSPLFHFHSSSCHSRKHVRVLCDEIFIVPKFMQNYSPLYV